MYSLLTVGFCKIKKKKQKGKTEQNQISYIHSLPSEKNHGNYSKNRAKS